MLSRLLPGLSLLLLVGCIAPAGSDLEPYGSEVKRVEVDDPRMVIFDFDHTGQTVILEIDLSSLDIPVVTEPGELPRVACADPRLCGISLEFDYGDIPQEEEVGEFEETMRIYGAEDLIATSDDDAPSGPGCSPTRWDRDISVNHKRFEVSWTRIVGCRGVVPTTITLESQVNYRLGTGGLRNFDWDPTVQGASAMFSLNH